MINLLDRQERQLVRREYYVRIVATTLALMGVVALFGATALLPALFVLRSSTDSLERRASEVAATLEKNDSDGTGARLVALREQLQTLAEKRPPGFHETLTALEEHRVAGIELTSISYHPGEKGVELRIGGVAATREALTSFRKRIETARGFTDVLLPVNNLARDRDIVFSITALYKP